MNGLREYERDVTLPALAGDADLCPPSPERITVLVDGAMRRDHRLHATSAELRHARWKPHVASAALFAVRFDDGSERLVTWKRYVSDKAERIARRTIRNVPAGDAELYPTVAWPNEHVVMSAFPCDRALKGLQAAFDARRMCRRLAGFERFEGQNLRYRRSTATLVRYKPERRAVVKFAAATRAPDRTLAFQTLGLRVLPRAHAVRTARARTVSGLESLGIAPRLVGHEERTGIVVEEWLDVVPNAHDDFQGAGEAAMALARLHALPCMVSPPPSREEDARSMLALFEVQRSAWTAARSILAVPPRAEFRVAWIHGDFHPDQTAHEPRTGFTRVLDWDGLASGDPLVDVASWVADAVACEDARAEAEFVHAYRTHGGAAFTDSELDRAVARALCARAGAVLRRLEKDALGRTARILDAALARLDLRGAVR